MQTESQPSSCPSPVGPSAFPGPVLPRVVMSPHSEPSAARSPGRIIQFWRKVGGASLTLSVLVHAGLLVLASLVVIATQALDQRVDFLPGGGTQQGAQASEDLRQRVQLKKKRPAMPMSRLVSTSINAALSLPEAPQDMTDLPGADFSAMSGGGKLMGNAGFGTGGAGGGFGGSLGLGAAKAFTGMTFFGKLGGDGLPGTFYDLKQDPERKKLEYLDSEAGYAAVINKAATRKFAAASMKDYYKSTQPMSFTFLAIPNISANEGPASFHVEKEVEPRGWFVHYGGMITPPEAGDWRFVGFFDDALIVYINGRPILDASWYPIVDHGEKRRDADIRQDFGGPALAGNRHAYVGKWVKLSGSVRIDIVVGERPGGRVGGLLLVQNKKARYGQRADGTPILPVFATTKLDMEDLKRVSNYANGSTRFEIASETPVFKPYKSPFDKDEK